MSAFLSLTRTEAKLFLREPAAVFFTVVFPALLIGILGSVHALRVPDDDLGGLRVIDIYVPIAITLSLAMVAVSVVPTALATYRERGVLRRLSTTPMPPWRLLAAQLLVCLGTTIIATVLVCAVGRVAFDVALPHQPIAFTLVFLLTAAALLTIGLFVAAIAPNGKAGNAIGLLLFFPMMFFAGLWVPREAMSPTLRRVGDFTPLGAGVHALQDAAHGDWPTATAWAVLAGYLIIFGVAAVKWFRWE